MIPGTKNGPDAFFATFPFPLRDKRKNVGGHRLSMNVETIASDALTKGTGLHGDAFTGSIADGNYDFDAMQTELVKGVSGKRLHAARRDTPTLPRLAYPVAEVTKLALRPEFIETRATKEIARVLAKNAVFECAALLSRGAAGRKPFESVTNAIVARAPWHPGAHRLNGFKHCGGEYLSI